MVDVSGDDVPNPRSLEAHYANYFEIGVNKHELVMDFGQLYPPQEAPTMHTRIVTSPNYAKELLDLLGRVIAEHQCKYKDVE